jgi:putative spermidine/putrescine transport system substrate-binding protein
MRASLSRRFLLRGSAGIILAGGTVRADPAAGHVITVGCWGGAYATALQSAVDAPLARNAGTTVRQVITNEQVRVARVAAPGAEGRLDVALLSDVDAYRLSLRQLFTPVTTAGVGTLPHVLPGLRVPYGVPQARTALCVAYNAAKLRYAPGGFAALFEAAGKGRVGFSSELAIHNLAAAAIAQRGSAASLETAKATFAALKRSGVLRIYPSNEALGEALASGEIEMAPMWRSRAYSWQQAGRDIRDAIPAEGAIPFVVLGCAPGTDRAAAGRTEPAMLYLDALLHPDAQRTMAQRLGLLPTVDTVRLDEKLLVQIGFTGSQRARFRPLSLAAVAQNGVALRHFWDQELA